VTFAAVISDLDGVLVDSGGATSRDVVAEHVAPALVDAEAALLLELEVSDTRGVVAFAGAAAVLAQPVVAIATSCTISLARARLRAAGLVEPDVLVSADQVARGKPAPDPYLLAAERLGVQPADCLVLEDAPSGIAAGRAAGMTVWAVTTTHAEASLGEAHRVAAGLPELVAALGARSAA